MDTKEVAKNIFTFKDEKPAPFQCDYTSSIQDGHIPLVIDNGKLADMVFIDRCSSLRGGL